MIIFAIMCWRRPGEKGAGANGASADGRDKGNEGGWGVQGATPLLGGAKASKCWKKGTLKGSVLLGVC